MIGIFKKLLGIGPGPDIRQLIQDGALVLDVRTPGEYAGGHVIGSVNIPLDRLSSQLQRLQDKNQPIITCCASGIRSSAAGAVLKKAGYTQVVNGGSWNSVRKHTE